MEQVRKSALAHVDRNVQADAISLILSIVKQASAGSL